MASSNEHMPMPSPAPKPRLSPLDFRNTELVSRLLAATPPYLYNMSLLPNSYFFSEMLRSLVQAKQENAVNAENMMTASMHTRRSRKRPWLNSRHEEFSKPVPKFEKTELNEWPKAQTEKTSPVELTTRPQNSRLNEDVKTFNKEKQPSFQSLQPDSSNPNLILPPAPPIWFPPIYPSPYVDPLHFFIDLRVSGHIYDKSQKDCANFERTMNKEHPSTVVSETNTEDNENPLSSLVQNRYSRHNSAFSVPRQKASKISPMNLSHIDRESKCTKFDVKSMGFEKNSNKTGINYVMSNIGTIYKDVCKNESFDLVTRENSEEKRTKLEEDENSIGYKYFSDNGIFGSMCNRSISRENSPVDVEHEEQECKIDIQS
ncbi:hypothetical protein HHI36_013121 [Cryptolaemus montrouzieri]|uniref:Uncharacterized protein n=1 Tax=Cryptolaemus montrouzieri TaxID=559131 RepID=A0ABD2NGR9_9CUCU